MSIDTILKELEEVPQDRLDDLYAVIQSFRINSQKKERNVRKILSFSGAFAEWSNNDFEDFQLHTKEARKELFSRDVTL